jgi:hypothetical protein
MKFDRQSPTGAPDGGAKGAVGAGTHGHAASLGAALQALTEAVLDQALGRLFDGADDVLFDQARRAGNNRDQSSHLETMRLLRLERRWIQNAFRESLRLGFTGDAVSRRPLAPTATDLDSLALTDAGVVEKAIAIANVVDRANQLYQQPLWDIGRRFAALAAHPDERVASQAMTPQALCDAFQSAVDSRPLEVAVAITLFQLFDRFVTPELATLYARALTIFDQYGIQPERLSVTRSRSPGPAAIVPPSTASTGGTRALPEAAPPPSAPTTMAFPLASPGAGFPASTPPANTARYDHGYGWSESAMPPEPRPAAGPAAPGEVTLRMLQGRPFGAIDRAGVTYSDEQLASDLMGAAMGQPVPGWAPATAQAYVRRSDAVGTMFSGILDDPVIPDWSMSWPRWPRRHVPPVSTRFSASTIWSPASRTSSASPPNRCATPGSIRASTSTSSASSRIRSRRTVNVASRSSPRSGALSRRN